MEKHNGMTKSASVRWFVGFLCVMAMLSLISRQLYTSKLALVTAEDIRHSKLSHTVNCAGTVGCDSVNAVFLPEGVLAESVYVHQGDKVEKDSRLLKLDTQSLKARYDELESERQKSLENGDGYGSEGASPVFAETGLRITDVCVKAGDKVSAGDELVKFDKSHLIRLINTLEADRNKDIIARNALTYKQAAAEADEESMGESYAEQIDTLDVSIEEQQSNIDRYLVILNSGCAIKATMEGTVTRVEAKAGQVTGESALMVISAAPEVSNGLLRIDEELEKLKALIDADGLVLSEYSGTVSRADISAGAVTAEGAALFIADVSEGGIYFSGLADEKSAKHLSAGDIVELYFRNGRLRTASAVISNFTLRDSDYRFEVPLTEETFSGEMPAYGEIGMMRTSALTEGEYYLISKEAVHGTGAKRFVYALEETDGFFGREYHAVKHYLNIEDENDTYVAVSSTGIAEDTPVIITSNRPLTDGARVRLSVGKVNDESEK